MLKDTVEYRATNSSNGRSLNLHYYLNFLTGQIQNLDSINIVKILSTKYLLDLSQFQLHISQGGVVRLILSV